MIHRVTTTAKMMKEKIQDEQDGQYTQWRKKERVVHNSPKRLASTCDDGRKKGKIDLVDDSYQNDERKDTR
jgi:hypothetical protein